ncbi:MAG TPA: hypothetical protein VH815_13880 [Acidobacteriota bacterium]|jgi:hypothetical protein
MTQLILVVAAFFACIVLCELVLKGTKLQTGLVKVFIVHAFCWIALLIFMVTNSEGGIIAMTIFWAGAFLTWFGVRSHIESSVLLRMLYLLRRQPVSADQLLSSYHSHYGKELRIEELIRGGLLESGSSELHVSKKGNLILRMVQLLK